MRSITKSQYAQERGVAPNTLSTWIARGHLTSPALLPDGRIDADAADRQLGNRLDVSRSVGKRLAASAPPPVADQAPAAAPAPQPLSEMEEIKLATARSTLRARLVADEAQRGRYVLADAVRREYNRELVQLIATIDQRLPELLAQLGLTGKDAVILARRWWRSLRQDEARAARDRAAEAPQFEIDRPSGWPMPVPQAEAVQHAA